jgi:dCMP deaminase
MNYIECLNKAYSYGKLYSTCLKVAVGSMFVTDEGKEYFGSNESSNDGRPANNCQANGYCYKAKESGIYESTEKTRYLCKAIHSEIHLLSKLKEKKVDPSKGTLFVTRYPCINCAKNLVAAGIKKVVYGGRLEISPDVNEIFNNASVSVEWVSECDYEDDIYTKQWWTDILYDKAYDIVKDRKYPVLIPSYNRPNPNTVSSVLSGMTDEYNYPIYVFVRKSQADQYEKLNHNKYVTFVKFPDSCVDNVGKVRHLMNKWAISKGFNVAIIMDDDLTSIEYTVKGIRGDGFIKAKCSPNRDIAKILAMMQYSMERAISKYGVTIGGYMPMFSSWKPEYCDVTQSILTYRGIPSQVFILNIKKMFDNGIYYNQTGLVHEDIAATIDTLKLGLPICVMPFITYTANPMDVQNWNYKTMRERFDNQDVHMKEKYSGIEWVSFVEKRDLPQTTINWRRYRKLFGITDYVFNLFNCDKDDKDHDVLKYLL